MRRFLSGVLALFICFTLIVPAFAAEVADPDLTQIAEPTYDPSIEYFCVEHLQPLIAAEDLQLGQVQICLGCHPEFLDMQPVTYADGSTPLFPSGVAMSKWIENKYAWTNCPTVIGEDQTILYKLNITGGGGAGNVLIRLIFSGQVSKMPYFNFSSTSDRAAITLPWSDVSGTVAFTPPGLIHPLSKYILGQQSNGYYPISLNKWDGSTISGNTLYFGFYDDSYSNPRYDASIGSFSFSGEPFGGTVGGPGGGPVTPPEPEPPGWDSPDGWLGGLISSIIEGIRELIDGISNIAGNIVKLPGLIADALRGMLNAIKSAVTEIGNQISGAINSMFEGIKGLWNDDSHHNNEVDNAISGLEQQDQQLGTVEDQILGDFTSQGSQLDTVMDGLTFPAGMSSAMTWITLQVNNMWSGLGADIRLVFTFSFVLGLALIFLGRWRA